MPLLVKAEIFCCLGTSKLLICKLRHPHGT